MKIYIKGELVIDLAITLENANKKGFVYIEDIVYDFLQLNPYLVEILYFVHEYGYRLGSPAGGNNNISYYGLYAPRNK